MVDGAFSCSADTGWRIAHYPTLPPAAAPGIASPAVMAALPRRLQARACHPIELRLQRPGGRHGLWQLGICWGEGVKRGIFEERDAATPSATPSPAPSHLTHGEPLPARPRSSDAHRRCARLRLGHLDMTGQHVRSDGLWSSSAPHCCDDARQEPADRRASRQCRFGIGRYVVPHSRMRQCQCINAYFTEG